MPFELFQADFGFAPLLVFVIYIIRAILKANKKGKNPGNPNSPQQKQPGKSIEDILRELEERASGRVPEKKQAPVPPPAPAPAPIPKTEPELIYENRHVKTVEDYRKEKHSDMDKHHMTEEKLHDGKFDEIDDRLLHLENFEAEEHEPVASTLLNVEDMRKAIILNTILQRPEF